jgi:RNA-directed DNA polymerase
MYIRPREKGLKRTKLKIKQMTDSTTLNDDYLAKVQAINALVRGWASYYRAVNPSRTFENLDAYVWLRL